MTYKNIDIILAQNLTTMTPDVRVLYRDRACDPSGFNMTNELLIKTVRAFIVKNKLIENSDLPAQIIDAMKNFMVKKPEDTTIYDINLLFTAFNYFEYTLLVVGRADLNEKEVELEYSDQTAFVIDNYSDNTANSFGFYTGYALNYDEMQNPLAMDFIPMFNLSELEMDIFDLNNAKFTYDLLKEKDQLDKFDDTIARSFLASRGMRYVICHNS